MRYRKPEPSGSGRKVGPGGDYRPGRSGHPEEPYEEAR